MRHRRKIKRVEKEQQMREGYKALNNASRSIARASKTLQKKVIPNYQLDKEEVK